MKIDQLADILGYQILEEGRCFDVVNNGLVIFSAYSYSAIHEFLFGEYVKTASALDSIKLNHKSFLSSKILFSVSELKINLKAKNVKLKTHKLTIKKKEHRQFSKKTFVSLLQKSAELALEYPAFIRKGRISNVNDFYDQRDLIASYEEIAESLGLIATSAGMFDHKTFLPNNFVMTNDGKLPLIIATKEDESET